MTDPFAYIYRSQVFHMKGDIMRFRLNARQERQAGHLELEQLWLNEVASTERSIKFLESM